MPGAHDGPGGRVTGGRGGGAYGGGGPGGLGPGGGSAAGGAGGGGVPDGLLIGIIVFLLGLTVLIWSSTGFAGLFSHGSWPDGVTFSRTPVAMRHLIAQPHDITGAWPATPSHSLSGYGLFWGLFISQLMVLLVLLLFVLSTVARWRAQRAMRRQKKFDDAPYNGPDGLAGAHHVPGRAAPALFTTPATPAGPVLPAPVVQRTEPVRPEPEDASGTSAAEASPAPFAAVTDAPVAPGASAAPAERSAVWAPVIGPSDVRRPAAVQAVRDAEGPVLVVTSDPSVWAETKDARAKLGPVLLYDPTHRCDTPARLHWSPSTDCADRDVAAERARALLAPVRPTAKIDSAVADTAETLLRCFLHAAAVDGSQFRQVHRWAQGTQVQDAVRTLRRHQMAASGAAGELEAALTAYPQRRDMAQELTARALSALSSVHIRDACTPNRADSAALDSFVAEGGTLYLVGEAIEDPKAHPGAMPLLTALASSVVERGRPMAERSSSGRLDPPFTLVLEDVAAVAPIPQLPALLASGADQGLRALVLLRSREQARSRWPDEDLPHLS